jgi:hypothetical protein
MRYYFRFVVYIHCNKLMKSLQKALLLLVFIGHISCGKKEDSGETQEQAMHSVDPRVGIYAYQQNRDTIRMEIQQFGSPVIGDLVISLAEKDKNFGTFNGYLRDSVLIAEYTYTSEGLSSIREVALKFRGDRVFLGSAPMEERGGKMVFVDRNQITYDESTPLLRQ